MKALEVQRQPSRAVLRKRCSENMQQIYRKTPMPKCGFEIALRHGCSPVIFLHILRITVPRNTTWWLLLEVIICCLRAVKLLNVSKGMQSKV